MIAILEDSERKKAGEYVEEYFNLLYSGKKEDINAFITFIYLIYKENSYTVKKEKSIRGKSILPACYVKINYFPKVSIEVLDENWEGIELNKESSDLDKSSLNFLKFLNDQGFYNVLKALNEEKLSFIKTKEGGMLIYPICLENEVKNFTKEN